MPHFKNALHPTLRLEDGQCFTTLKSIDEKEIPELRAALEFTIWSPECYSEIPDVPSDLLAFTQGEMRIYHASTNEQLEKLLQPNQKDLKICGFRPRLGHGFKLPGISFCEELPSDIVGVSATDLELTQYALNDLCVLINQASNHWSLLESTDHFQETFEMMSSFLPRVVRTLTDELDVNQIANFKHDILTVRGYKNRKIFFSCFYEMFLSEKSLGSKDLFVALMVQRAQALELFNSNEKGLDFLTLSKASLKPIISSIDVILYKNFIGPHQTCCQGTTNLN
jgi:hypothetical protein